VGIGCVLKNGLEMSKASFKKKEMVFLLVPTDSVTNDVVKNPSSL
jgi:hypothetical protein